MGIQRRRSSALRTLGSQGSRPSDLSAPCQIQMHHRNPVYEQACAILFEGFGLWRSGPVRCRPALPQPFSVAGSIIPTLSQFVTRFLLICIRSAAPLPAVAPTAGQERVVQPQRKERHAASRDARSYVDPNGYPSLRFGTCFLSTRSVLLFVLASITPQGLGVVETMTALVFTAVGSPLHVDTVVPLS